MLKSDHPESVEGQAMAGRVFLNRENDKENNPPIVKAQTIEKGALEAKTVLLSDDEPAIRDIAGRVLRKIGYSVLEASNGLEAIEIAEKYEGIIHLVVTDITMPEIGGRELIKNLKTIRPFIKVLFISGIPGHIVFTDDPLDLDGDFLQKPFSIKEFTDKVNQIMDAKQ